MRFDNFWRDVLAPTIAVLCAVTIIGVVVYNIFKEDSDCGFCPVRIERLELSDRTVQIGQTVILYDGICNDYDIPLNAQIYLGAETVGTPSLTSRTVDLLRRNIGDQQVPVTDTPEGRIRRTLEPGCTATDPITGIIPPTFSVGKWQLKVHIVVTGPQGEIQELVKVSHTFEVLEPE